MGRVPNVLLHVAAVLLFAVIVKADVDANCTYEDIRGSWVFQIGEIITGDPQKDCTNDTKIAVQYQVRVKLDFPDVATDEFGNKGFWTLIYNQGFEVVVGGNKFFGFSQYIDEKTSLCSGVKPGWAHDVLGNDMRCFQGQKQGPVGPPKTRIREDPSLRFQRPIHSKAKAARINSAQTSWTATTYPQFENLSVDDFVNMVGGKASKLSSRPSPAAITKEQEKLRANFPASFDWRNVNGENFVSPVRDQGVCGSCFAFASVGMAEARLQIMTNNSQKHEFSPQDIVECSAYSQGCDGGFIYLTAGKYAEDFGFVEEKCNPYKGKDGKCSTDQSCVRNYVTDYKYIGGYYGASNEVAMMEAIYNRGPVAVGFYVYDDFPFYKSGVYHHVFDSNRFEPFELLNHAVLVVGWGEVTSPTPDRYWIVKNSWGAEWGNEGYFWIRRGNNECGIESIAGEATPIIRYK